MKSVVPAVIALLQVQPTLAAQATATCDIAALSAAETYGVPPKVMLAITRVETGRSIEGSLQPWPWAVNQAGTSHWFDSSTEAVEFVRAAMDAGHSNIDIGCFQLNLRWHGGAFSSLQEMFDPVSNADHAARFLVENHDRKGNWVDAVAAYHSATPVHAEAYIGKVELVLGNLADSTAPEQPSPEPSPTRTNRFPLLQPGAGGAMASLVATNQMLNPLFVASP